MRAHSSSDGFTILEVIIFLTVTTALFTIAFGAFNGQQQRTQFSQSVRDLEQKLRDVSNDVATGYYPSSGDFTCREDDDGPKFITTLTTEQGKNEQCIFVGRVIHFGSEASCTSSPTSCDEIDIYTLAGNRYKQDGVGNDDSSTIADSLPHAIYPTNADSSDPDVDATENYPTKYGARITKVFVTNSDGTPTPIGALGFMSNFDGNGGLAASGSSTTEVYSFESDGDNAITMGQPAVNAVSYIQSVVRETSNLGIGEGVTVCLESDANGQVAAVIFGANGSALTTRSVFGNEAVGCDE